MIIKLTIYSNDPYYILLDSKLWWAYWASVFNGINGIAILCIYYYYLQSLRSSLLSNSLIQFQVVCWNIQTFICNGSVAIDTSTYYSSPCISLNLSDFQDRDNRIVRFLFGSCYSINGKVEFRTWFHSVRRVLLSNDIMTWKHLLILLDMILVESEVFQQTVWPRN